LQNQSFLDMNIPPLMGRATAPEDGSTWEKKHEMAQLMVSNNRSFGNTIGVIDECMGL
jgi:hypothetical protein